MQEDANRGVPRGPGEPVTNASTASARDAAGGGSATRWLVMGGGIVLLAVLVTLLA